MNSLLAIIAGYLIGSLSFAVIISKLMGLSDPRTYGSGNPGATNVLRSGNKLAAVLTLLLDAVKGWLPVWAVLLWGNEFGLNELAAPGVAIAAFFGHVWPVFFRFKGGKGVATAAGVLLGLQPWLGVATLLTWVIVAFFSRISSLAAIAAAFFAPAYYLFGDRLAWQADGLTTLSIAIMSAVLLYRHSANISRLIAGTEPGIGGKK